MSLGRIFLTIISVFFLTHANAFAVTTISIMTFNIENGGTQVSFNKVIEAIKKSGADVVGIQEAWGNTQRIAKALGWKHYDPRQQVVSKYPLFDAPNSDGKYVFIAISPKKVIALANTHLPDEPYGPDLVKKGVSIEDIEANERKVRLAFIMPTLEKMKVLANKGIPVFITGDFNSPSDLDWNGKVEWVVTRTLSFNGFDDSFRITHPNAVAVPALTWPAGRPIVKNTTDNFNPSAHEAADRIDFIFSDNAKVINSQLVGEKQAKNVAIAVTPWPSDHRAVVSRFEVKPFDVSAMQLESVSKRLPLTGATPKISVEKAVVKQGEIITIHWKNSAGNRYDYITITPIDAKLKYDSARIYTHAVVSGTVHCDKKNIVGNWSAWHQSNAIWPLTPGQYEVKLMNDDSFDVLATAKLTIIK